MAKAKPEVTPSPESAPRLKAVKGVNAEGKLASRIGEAMDNAQGGAGQEDLDWVLANPTKAGKMLKGGTHYFFPEAAFGAIVPCVHWDIGRFWRGRGLRVGRWLPNDRVVVRD